ncbi:hypothetical protein AeRB84_009245, partial [Aphanomyces euteiches]
NLVTLPNDGPDNFNAFINYLKPTPTQEISLKTLISALLNEEEKCKERKRTRPYHQNPDRDNYEKKEWLKTIYVLRRLCELKYDPKMDMLKHITNIPLATFAGWRKREFEYLNTKRRGNYTTLTKTGRPEDAPFANELIQWMDDTRQREEVLTTSMIFQWLLENQEQWVRHRFGDWTIDTTYNVILQWCSRFSRRHKFSFRVPCHSKLSSLEMSEKQSTFSSSFWQSHLTTTVSDIINVDETPLTYRMTSRRTLSRIGGSSRVKGSSKHSERVTVVLGIRADGRKLPPMIIFKGQPGGMIERREFPRLPPGAIYAVQKRAYMDTRVWKQYLTQVIKSAVEGPTLLVVDNFMAHVSPRALHCIEHELEGSVELVCLPANSTSDLQPLDVSIMGPFKSLCRAEYMREVKVDSSSEKRMKLAERAINMWQKVKETTVV